MDDYDKTSWKGFAKNYELRKSPAGKGFTYYFPPDWPNGWITEMHPAKGLYVSSAWFTPNQTMTHTIDTDKPCMWILCIDCGDILYSTQGVKTSSLIPFNHIIINPQKKFKFSFTKDVHYCFTSVLIYEDFIDTFVKTREDAPKIRVEDAKQWREVNYNTPDTMLIMEQIRFNVRNTDMPLLGFEGMVLHLLSCITRNYPEIPKYRSKRRHYITWEYELKVYKVKSRIDKEIRQIDEDVLKLPDIKEMCKISGMSESKLRLSFRTAYGMPLNDYIRTETMKKAMLMLSDDRFSIRNIADMCGYKNAAKFTAAFKDVHGITPSGFRKALNL